MVISIIVAMAKNRAIGCDGRLPWQLPSDLQRFRELTMGHVLLMGRQTYESIGKALDGRRTIVLSRNSGFVASGCDIAADMTEALRLVNDADQLFVCGGADVYQQSLHLAQRIYLTELVDEFDGDCFFPALPVGRFQEVWCEKVVDSHDYFFSILETSGNLSCPDENKG